MGVVCIPVGGQHKIRQWKRAILQSDICKNDRIGLDQILLLDSENKKLQGHLENSLLTSAYEASDVFSEPAEDTKMVRDDAWHKDYMQKLADYVTLILDEADEIPDYLSSNMRSEYAPTSLFKGQS